MDRSQAEAKRLKNIEQGLPARSYFPWDFDEKSKLVLHYKSGDSYEVLANLFERKVTAIVGKLRKLGCISEVEFGKYLLTPQKDYVETHFQQYGVHSLWHMTHKDNVRSIIKDGILNHYSAHNMREHPVDISDPDAQRWRERTERNHSHRLHEYVPLYITPKNPMLYVRRNIQNNLCLLQISLDALVNSEFLISDGNAASRDTHFFKSLKHLDQVPWAVLKADLWTGFPDGKRQRCSEVLVYQKIYPENIEAIHCYSSEVVAYLNKYAKNIKLSRDLFF